MSVTENYGFTLQDDKSQNFRMTILDENLELIDTAIATKEDMLPILEKTKLTDTIKTTVAEVDDTIETSYWSATAPYTQNITLSVAGHTITDADYDLNIYRISNTTEAIDKLEMEAYSHISKAVISADNTLTLTAYNYKPLTDINIKIEVIKKW